MMGRSLDTGLSVAIVSYRMSSQIAKTLQSLVPPYQVGLHPEEYEIVLVDNGSPEPLPESAWRLSGNVQYHYLPPAEASPNPGVALNRAVRISQGEIVCLMIDGARMVTPGTLAWGLTATRLSPTAVTEVRGWHLGPKNQSLSITESYTPDVERRLLDRISWPTDGYRLFEICAPSGSARTGFFDRARESNCVFMHRAFFEALDGYDERYAFPGGGMVNIDFWRRAVERADPVFTLLGEGTFHQAHGGAATGLPPAARQEAARQWRAEYEQLSRPVDRNPPPYDPVLIGHLPAPCHPWLLRRD